MDKQAQLSSVWFDAVRGLAALTVVLSHSRLVFFGSAALAIRGAEFAHRKGPPGSAAPEAAGFGHMAVIVFFVLSGYLVGGGALRRLREGRWSASSFAIARMSRLWTVLISALLLGYALDHIGSALAGPGSIYLAPPGQIVIKPTLPEAMQLPVLLGNLFFLQGIVVAPFGTNFPLWTLAYEFWFYAAFPFLLFLLWPKSSGLTRLGCALFLLLIYLFVGHRIAIYFCFWLFGVLVELLPKRFPHEMAKYLTVAGSVVFVAVLIALLKARLPLMLSDAVESLAFAGLCYLVVHNESLIFLRGPAKGARGLAAMSYTLYLAHLPILVFLCNLAMPAWATWSFTPVGLAKYSAVTTSVFALAIVLHWLFERQTPLVRGWMTENYERVVGLWRRDLMRNPG